MNPTFDCAKDVYLYLFAQWENCKQQAVLAPFGLVKTKVIAAGSRGLPPTGESLLRPSRMFLAVVRLSSPQAEALTGPAIKNSNDVFGRILIALSDTSSLGQAVHSLAD
jgi:hypothetical protein